MSWDCVLTTNGTLSMLHRFVDNARAMGCHHVHVHHDDPARACPLVADDVTNIICDTDYWQDQHGERPESIEERQLINATRAWHVSRADWVLSCDLDEHVWHPGDRDSLNGWLDSLPADVQTVQVLPIEAIYAVQPVNEDDIFATPFFKSIHAPWRSKVFWREHGRPADLVDLQERGFWGHTAGKSFTRTGIPDIVQLPLHEHATTPDGRSLGHVFARAARLRHYDCLPLEAWTRKHVDRIEGRSIAARMGGRRKKIARHIARLLHDQGLPGLEGLHRDMYCPTPEVIAAGLEAGLIVEVPPTTAATPAAAQAPDRETAGGS